MKKYIIWTPSIKLNSGGVTLLHRLAHMINKLGFKAYLWPGDNNFETFLINAKYDVSLASKNMVNDDAIIVYPEITIGNPLNAKHVVRWILNRPGSLGGDGIFGKEDMIFYFSDAFTNGKENIDYLQIMELYGDLFINRQQEREGSCYIMRKGKGRAIQHDLTDSFEILDSTPSEDLVKIFNEKKYFYCYDYSSFITLQAALCGCISIIVPFEGVTSKEWMGLSATRKYGIAYGEENIEYAIMTMDKVRPHLKLLEKGFYNNVDNFLIKTQDWANGNRNQNNADLTYTSSDFRTVEKQIIEAERLIEQGELNIAKELLEKIGDSAHNVEVFNNLAIVSILEENYDEAKAFVDKVLQIDKTNDMAIDNYEYLSEIILETQKSKEVV